MLKRTLISVALVAGMLSLLTGCSAIPWRNSGKSNGDGELARHGGKFDDKDGSMSRRFASGRSFEDAGKWDEARQVYEKLIVDFPDSDEAYHRLGVVADRQRRHREAQSLYSEALRRKPNDAEIFNDLGYSFFLQGQLTKANSALSKAVAIAPASARYRNNLGLVLGHQGQLDEALEHFRQAGSEADAQYNMAFVLAAKDDVAGAKERFHQALAADPTYAPARKALRSFEKAESDPDQDLYVADEETAGGARLVPYVEASERSEKTSEIVQASAVSPLKNAGSATRALNTQSRQSMQERMAKQ